MTQTEQLLLKLGVDTSAVAKGLRSFRQQVGQAMSSVQGQIAQVFGAAALYSQFAKLGDMSERIRNNAEAWNVSTKFVQDIENVARAAGVSSEKVQGLMDKLVKTLPAGTNVEQAFFQIADRLAAIPDPAERARFAIEYFGKSGLDVVRIAGQGSAAIRELAASYQTLSDVQLKKLDDAKQKIEDTQHSLTILFGKLISLIAETGAAWGGFFGGKDTIGKSPWQILGEWSNKPDLVEYDKEAVEKRRAAAKIAHAERMKQYQTAMAKAEDEQRRAQDKADKERQKAAEAFQKKQEEIRKDLRKSVAEYKDSVKTMKEAHSARTEWTLGDIAALDPMDLARNARWKIGAAQDVEDLRREAKFLRLEGRDAQAEFLINRSDELAKSIGGLAASEADPDRANRENIAKTAEAVGQLSEAAQSVGIKIIPINGV